MPIRHGPVPTPEIGRTGNPCTPCTCRLTGFIRELTQEWGAAAAAALAKDAPRPQDLAAATGLDVDEVGAVWARMVAKLESEPIEDLRVDLEDGYGTRPDEEEDRHAVAAGEAIAAAVKAGSAPPFLGIRFKSLEGGTRRRGLRSLDLVLGALLADGPLPAGWVVTLPKVTSVSQVSAFVDVCGRLERAYGLDEVRSASRSRWRPRRRSC